jgi:hypothetical protein
MGSLPPQSTHCGTEGDPRDAPTGARTRASAPAAALTSRRAKDGIVGDVRFRLCRLATLDPTPSKV